MMFWTMRYKLFYTQTAAFTSALLANDNDVNFLFVAGLITWIFFEDFDLPDPLINK